MHAAVTAGATVIVIVTLSIGCSQPVAPTRQDAPGIATGPVGGGIGAAQEVPFRGRLEGTFTVVPDPPPSPFLSVDFDHVAGTATHLGRFTLKGPHRVNVSTTPVTATGIFEFTTISGDVLTAEFTGSATFQAPGVVSIVETATLTGGTGRFAAAAGTFILTRTANQTTGLTSGSFEGTISAPGARED